LQPPDGRDFLRIPAHLAGHSGVATQRMPQPLRHSSVGGQLDALATVLLAEFPEPVVRERLAMLIGMLTAVLADRARRIDERAPVLLDHAAFVDNTVAMLTAAVRAPDPGPSPGRTLRLSRPSAACRPRAGPSC